MNSERLAGWLSIIGSLGVVVGLVFLAVEVRQASDIAQAQMLDSLVSGHNELNLAAFSDPQLARVVVVGFYEPERLSDAEAAQFQFYFRARLNQELRLSQVRALGFESAENREAELRQVGAMLATPGGQLFLEDNINGFPKDLLREIEPFLSVDADLGLRLGRRGPFEDGADKFR